MSGIGAAARLGIAISSRVCVIVLVDDDDRIVGRATADGDHALARALADIGRMVDPGDIALVSIAGNPTAELIAAGGGSRVAAVRIGMSDDTAVPPFAGWPRELLGRVTGPRHVGAGGYDTDGTEVDHLDLDAIAAFARECRGVVDAVAVTASFSLDSPEPEDRVAEVMAAELGPDIALSVSHRVGGFGLLERENATILNASLTADLRTWVDGIEHELAHAGIRGVVHLAQSDGTLMAASAATHLPIRLLAGRMASAVRGAAHLADPDHQADRIVIDRLPGEMRAGGIRRGEIVMQQNPVIAGLRINQPVPLGFTRPPVYGLDAVDYLRRQMGEVPLVTDDALAPGESAAYGAAIAPVGARRWGFSSGASDQADVLERLRRAVIDEAVLAGADPAQTRVRGAAETHLSYMGDGSLRLSVHATGAPYRRHVDSRTTHREGKHRETLEDPPGRGHPEQRGARAERLLG